MSQPPGQPILRMLHTDDITNSSNFNDSANDYTDPFFHNTKNGILWLFPDISKAYNNILLHAAKRDFYNWNLFKIDFINPTNCTSWGVDSFLVDGISLLPQLLVPAPINAPYRLFGPPEDL